MGYKVSKAVVKRLPKYYRYLKQIKSKGIVRVSSSELSQITGLTPSQIRQDLNHFGGFGQQGYGYNVEELIGELQNILGMTVKYNAIILGAGNIGQAIAQYTGLSDTKFNITAIFDKSKKISWKENFRHRSQSNRLFRALLKEEWCSYCNYSRSFRVSSRTCWYLYG